MPILLGTSLNVHRGEIKSLAIAIKQRLVKVLTESPLEREFS
jgi:hypothetical protein